MSKSEKTPQEMSTQELEQMLAQRKKNEREKLEKERKEYEQNRDQQVEEFLRIGKFIAEELISFKTDIHHMMNDQHEKLDSYGKIRSSSKGGFSVTNSEGTMRITRIRATEPTWDERSHKAVELIKDFLSDTVKKRSKKLYEILMSFVQRNQAGDLEYSKVMDLLVHEDKYDDPRWVEGLRLIKESYSLHLKAYQYQLKIKDESGKWNTINLNFSSL